MHKFKILYETRHNAALVMLLIVIPLLAWYVLRPLFFVGYFQDDAAYILGGQSLMSGHYNALYTPGNPPESKYQPGLPFILGIAQKLLRMHGESLTLFSAAFTAAAGILIWRLAAGYLSAPVAALVALFFVINPESINSSAILIPEPLFLALIAAVFLGWRRALHYPSRRLWLAIGGLMTFASLTRPEGVIIILAVAGGLLQARRWEAAILTAGTSASAWLAWTLRSRLQDASPDFPYFLNQMAQQAQNPALAIRQADAMLRSQILGGVLGCPPWSNSPWQLIISYVVLLIFLLLVISGMKSLSRRFDNEAEIWLAITGFVVAHFVIYYWGGVIEGRYALTVLPFFLLFSAEGLSRLLDRGRRWHMFISLVVVVILCQYASITTARWHKFHQIRQEGALRFPTKSLEWIVSHTDIDDTFLGWSPMIRLYTGRQGYGIISATDAQQFYETLLQLQVRYLFFKSCAVASAHGPSALNKFDLVSNALKWTLHQPNYFALVYENPQEATQIFKVLSRM